MRGDSFYVAVTRSQKYLFASWSPGASTHARRPSAFFFEMTEDSNVLTRESLESAAAITSPCTAKGAVASDGEFQ